MAKYPAQMQYNPKIGKILKEISDHINEQTGNTTSSKAVLRKILGDFLYLQDWPWIGTNVKGMEKNWRQSRVGNNYLLYYFVTDDSTKIYALSIRHVSQKPLQPATLRKYKKETPD